MRIDRWLNCLLYRLTNWGTASHRELRFNTNLYNVGSRESVGAKRVFKTPYPVKIALKLVIIPFSSWTLFDDSNKSNNYSGCPLVIVIVLFGCDTRVQAYGPCGSEACKLATGANTYNGLVLQTWESLLLAQVCLVGINCYVLSFSPLAFYNNDHQAC